VSTEIEVAPPQGSLTPLDEMRAAERELLVATIRYSLVAIPICVAIWIAIMSIALALADSGSFVVALPVAAGIGVIAGLFFGAWAAFLAKADRLEAADRHGLHAEG
jgi:hypothetical protein